MVPEIIRRLFIGGLKEDEEGAVIGYDDAPYKGVTMVFLFIAVLIYSAVTSFRDRKK